MLSVKSAKSSLRLKSKARFSRRCNLCDKTFVAHVPHRCFCDECKLSSDLYRYGEWLPDAPPELELEPAPVAGDRAA